MRGTRKLVGLILSWGLLACPPLSAETPEANEAHHQDAGTPQSVSVRIYRNFLVVAEGQFGASLQHQNFVVDTGTAPSIINVRIARELGLTTTAGTMTAIGQVVSTRDAILPELAFGTIRVTFLRVEVQDLSRLERDLGIAVAAVIGMDVLSQSSFRLDYDNHRIDFGDSPRDGIPVPFDVSSGIAVTRLTMNGKTLRMLVDTGSDRVALLGRNSEDAVRFGLQDAAFQHGSSLAANNLPVRVLLEPNIILGGQHFSPQKAYFIPGATDPAFDGLLGVRALSFRALSFNREHAILYLQR